MKVVLKLAAAALAISLIGLVGFVADAQIRIAREETLSPDSGVPGRFVTVEGRRLHIATVGDISADPSGAPLLLLHGFGVQGHAAWLPWATKLAATRSLIMPDLLGFGHSDRETAPGPYYTVQGQAAAIAGALDSLGVTQVDIIGDALGGAVAAQLALDDPARVRRIVFMDATIYSQPHHTRTGIRLIDRALTWRYRAGGPGGKIARSCGMQTNCRWLRLARVRGTTDALLAMDATRDDGHLPEYVAKIAIPSLVIWGGNDAAAPVADGDRLAQTLKTTITIIADSGDMPYIAQPDKVARRVLEFFQANTAP